MIKMEKIESDHELIIINNDGQKLVETNYFETQQCKKGVMFLSWNAGCGRLLVPPQHESIIPDMIAGCHHVVVTHGQIPEHAREGYCMLFEDYSSTPFSISVSQEQVDVKVSTESSCKLAVYTKDGLKVEFRSYIRALPSIHDFKGLSVEQYRAMMKDD